MLLNFNSILFNSIIHNKFIGIFLGILYSSAYSLPRRDLVSVHLNLFKLSFFVLYVVLFGI